MTEPNQELLARATELSNEALDLRLRAAQLQLEASTLVGKAWGIKVGDVVRDSKSEIKIVKINDYSTRFRPSIQGSRRKKDGSWGVLAVHIGSNWEPV